MPNLSVDNRQLHRIGQDQNRDRNRREARPGERDSETLRARLVEVEQRERARDQRRGERGERDPGQKARGGRPVVLRERAGLEGYDSLRRGSAKGERGSDT